MFLPVLLFFSGFRLFLDWKSCDRSKSTESCFLSFPNVPSQNTLTVFRTAQLKVQYQIGLCRPDIVQELFDLLHQVLRFAVQAAGCRQNLTGCFAFFFGGLAQADDVLRDILGAGCGFGNVAGNFAGCCILFTYGGGNACRNLGQFIRPERCWIAPSAFWVDS